MAATSSAAAQGGFVITVLFTVKPEAKDAFRSAVVENAALSLKNEPGCEVFDVCESFVAPEFFLYEVYGSEQDFKAHLETEHFRQFDKLCASWVTGKQVTRYARLR
jgi:(4S)-4-hydroxy-5-phosphonooxypentane-2,3-dione isomerase